MMSTRSLMILSVAFVVLCAALGVMWSLAASERDEAREQLAQAEQKRQAQDAIIKRMEQEFEENRLLLFAIKSGTNLDASPEPEAAAAPAAPSAEELGVARVAELEKQFLEAVEKNDPAAFLAVLEGVLDLDPAAFPALIPVINRMYEEKGSLENWMDMKSLRGSDTMSEAGFMRIAGKVMSGGANPLMFYLASNEEANPKLRSEMLKGIGQMAKLTGQEADAAKILGESVSAQADPELFNDALKGLAALGTPEAVAILTDKLDEGNLSRETQLATLKALGRTGSKESKETLKRYAASGDQELADIANQYMDHEGSGMFGMEVRADTRPSSTVAGTISLSAEEARALDELRWTTQSNLNSRNALMTDSTFKDRLVQMATVDPDPALRTEALGLLVSGLNATAGQEEAVAIIEQAMPSQSVEWRQTAVVALGQMHSPPSSKLLEKIQTQDPDEKTRKLASLVLQEAQGMNTSFQTHAEIQHVETLEEDATDE